jgi:hypothetical protein
MERRTRRQIRQGLRGPPRRISFTAAQGEPVRHHCSRGRRHKAGGSRCRSGRPFSLARSRAMMVRRAPGAGATVAARRGCGNSAQAFAATAAGGAHHGSSFAGRRRLAGRADGLAAASVHCGAIQSGRLPDCGSYVSCPPSSWCAVNLFQFQLIGARSAFFFSFSFLDFVVL